MPTIQQQQQQLLDELALFQDWTERYEYVISLGKKLPPLPPQSQTPDHLIKGCQSQVWLDAHLLPNGTIQFLADSDSLITKGMIALFIRIFDQQTPDNILTADFSFIDQTGLREHLAPTRANALTLMTKQLQKYALNLTTQNSPSQNKPS